MKLTKERREELEIMVKSFCDEKDLDFKKDIFVQLNKLGFEVVSTSFKKSLSGLIMVDEHNERLGVFSTNKVIAYDKDLKSNLYLMRFVLAHELAHYISQKADANNERVVFGVRDLSDREAYRNDIYEQEMDYMAAALLVPKAEFVENMKARCQEVAKKNPENPIPQLEDLNNDLYFIQSMQRLYRVDEALIRRRIEEVCEVAA